VHLDAGFRLRLRIGVATEVVAAVDHQHSFAEQVGGAFGDGQPEESGADDDQIEL
jgi:hypothetical protein